MLILMPSLPDGINRKQLDSQGNDAAFYNRAFNSVRHASDSCGGFEPFAIEYLTLTR